MATIDAAGLLTQIRAVLDSGSGELRTVANTTYGGAVYEGHSDNALSTKALVRPRFEPRITAIRPHPLSPPRNNSIGLYDVDIEVSVYRHIDASEKLTDATRDTARAAAMADGDVIAQALEWPANVTGVTGLLGNCLMHVDSKIARFDLVDGKPGLIETLHRFHAYMSTAQAMTYPFTTMSTTTLTASTTYRPGITIPADVVVTIPADIVLTIGS